MEFLLVTGLSGAGKSLAMNTLEDIGFYCVDNMPPQLIEEFSYICKENMLERVAIAVDVRAGGDFFNQISDVIQRLTVKINLKILFLESSDEIIEKRYKETRRNHPLDRLSNGNIRSAIVLERQYLNALREMASYYIDTSYLSTSALKEEINNIFLEKLSDSMRIKVSSFGFKYGANSEADLLFDVRCLPNPFYITELRSHTGLEDCVRDFVMQYDQSKELLEKLEDMLEFLVPLYIKEGKSRLVISFGCTGGKHRSVTFAELIGDYLESLSYKVTKQHRDINRN